MNGIENKLEKMMPILNTIEKLNEGVKNEPATNIFSIDDDRKKETWRRYTDNIIAIEQGDNLVILKEPELKILENIIGAKFKC